MRDYKGYRLGTEQEIDRIKSDCRAIMLGSLIGFVILSSLILILAINWL